MTAEYVDTDFAGTSDGTSTYPWKTRSEAEANKPASFSEDHYIYFKGSAADTTGVIVSGSTRNGYSLYFIPWSGDELDGTALDTSKHRISTTSNIPYDVFESDTVISDQIISTVSIGIRLDASADNCIIYQSIIDGCLWGIYCQDGSVGNTVDTTIFYDTTRAPIGIASTTASTSVIEATRCTAVDFNSSDYNLACFFRERANGQVKAVGCISEANSASTRGDFGSTYTYISGTDYNLSSDTTAPGGNSVVSTTLTYSARASNDFGKTATDTAAIDISGLSSGLSLDIAGISIPQGTYEDIGADEYPASGVSGTGSLQAQSSQVAGTGELEHPGTGALQAQASQVAGIGALGAVVTGTGSLQAQSSQVTGTGELEHPGTGALQAQASQVAGTGELEHPGTGALQAQSSQIAGTGELEHPGTGALQAQNSQISGSGLVASGVIGSGSLQAQASQVSGSAVLEHSAIGALMAGPSQIAGIGFLEHPGTGALQAGPSTISGSGIGGSIPPAAEGLTHGGIGKRAKPPKKQFLNVDGRLIQVSSYKEAVRLYQHLKKTEETPKKRRVKLKFNKDVNYIVMDSPEEPMPVGELKAYLGDMQRIEDSELLLLLLTF